MIRRIHVSILQPGKLPLDAAEAHHALQVLRLTDGTTVEVFDDAGHIAQGVLSAQANGVHVRVERVPDIPETTAIHLTVAAAVPKGDRVDWMIQKLSELGVDQFVPLITARSVVIPAGKNKAERWVRLAVEAAKQSRRPGVMEIAELTHPQEIIAKREAEPVWYLSLTAGARSIVTMLNEKRTSNRLTLMVGPEGGWTSEEMRMFDKKRALPVALTPTVLRIETAAIAAAAVVACWQS